MPIYAPPSRRNVTGDFLPCPDGTHNAVCVDVGLPYLLRSEYAGEIKERVVFHLAFQVDERMSDGRPFVVTNKFTVSLYEKANLFTVFLALMRRVPSKPEADESAFDFEQFIGRPCMVNVIHKPDKEGRIWANVAAVTPHMKGLPVLKPESYQRWQDRDKKPKWWPSNPVALGTEFEPQGEEPPYTDAEIEAEVEAARFDEF